MDLTPRISVVHMPAQQNFALHSIRVVNVMDMIWIMISGYIRLGLIISKLCQTLSHAQAYYSKSSIQIKL